MTIIQQVEKHIIKKGHPYYTMFCEFTHQSKNLYNHANYLVRKEFLETGKWLRSQDLDKILRQDFSYPDYTNMPAAQSAQQTLRLLDTNWKSFFKSIKDWSKNKEKYSGKPKLPKYKPKDGKLVLIVTNQQIKQKEDLLTFPKSFQGFKLKPRCVTLANFEKINQIRIVPNNQVFCVEIVYSVSIDDTLLSDNGRYMSIDLGLDNLATVVTNTGLQPIVVNGKGLKSINQYYNKVASHYMSVAKQMNIEKICYKARSCGIQVILTEESYTSGTSFLDNELPQKDFYNKKRRVHRGLFVSNEGIQINADVNAAYQILKKVFPNEFSDGIEGVVLHPVRVDVV